MNYADLQVTTHFSFLRGVSSAEELFSTAAVLGIKALGIVDRNSLAGMVRAHEAAKVTGVRLIVGCRLDLAMRHLASGLSDRSQGLWPSVPASDGRQNDAPAKALVISIGRMSRNGTKACSRSCCPTISRTRSKMSCKSCTASSRIAPIAPSPAAFCPMKPRVCKRLPMPPPRRASLSSPPMTCSITSAVAAHAAGCRDLHPPAYHDR